MFPIVSYADYQRLGGTLDEGAFNASSKAALGYVRDVIGFNEPKDTADEAAYIRAVCAAVEVDVAYGASGGIGENVSSVSMGRFSASMKEGASSYETDMYRAIKRELRGTTLLYQGIA